LNPIVARALRASVRPRSLLGLAGAALLVLASARGLAPDPIAMPGLRVTPVYFGLCLAELYGLLVIVTITAAAAIASERQERTWDALATSTLSDTELGTCPRIRPCFGLAPGFPLGFGLVGLGPTLGAHYPPQLTPALQLRRQIFKRLWVRQISCHSAETFSKPRSRNPRMPRAPLIWPKTGSTICFRAA
jgi:hypothetical protein